MRSLHLLLSVSVSAAFFTSCGLIGPKAIEETKPEEPQKAIYVNPYPAGTYENFTHRLDYKQTWDIYRDEVAYAAASPSETSIVLNLSTLRGQLFNGQKKVILDYPIASGTSKHPTPKGKFNITEKIVDKESNLYGKILDANGVVVKSDADSRKDKVPSGGKFDGADMPYWMRLTSTGIGMHQGRVPRYPASHGCIRHTMDGVKQVYAKVKIGTSVTIK